MSVPKLLKNPAPSIVLGVLIVLVLAGCSSKSTKTPPQMIPDGGVPGPDEPGWPNDQVKALIAQMTFDEKVQQLGNTAPGIPQLKVPPYQYWSECLHGVLTNGATSFPQAIALGSTWDLPLVEEVASAISDEARAFHVTQGKGLTYWAPVINMLRDPRWGRFEESYSEDPWQMARTGVAFVRGLQGYDPKYLKLVATPKHYAGNNTENHRHDGSSDIDEQLLHEYYLPAFEATVREAGAFSVMAAYNEVNGVPASANPELLGDILRGSFGFKGYVVSDCDAVADITNTHHWTDDLATAAARALLAGTDLNCGDTYQTQLANARQRGLIAERDVDRALLRVLRARFLLGEFAPATEAPFASLDARVIASPQFASLALKAAREAMVLLKNEGGLLPLDAGALHSIAVIGPHANDVTLGGYSGQPVHTVSLLDALQARLTPRGVTVTYQPGVTITGPADAAAIAAAATAAGAADVAVVVVGTSQDVLREDLDRPDWQLPGAQGDLLQAVLAANPKTVVVLVTAGPLGIDWAQAHVPSILTAFYDGQEQGTAMADVLFGDVNPGGKLTTTWYSGDATLPPITDYDLRKGRTYLYYTGQPLYPFGFGLSYTTFTYANLSVWPASLGPSDTLTVSFDVSNSGSSTGDEVPQLYLHDVQASVPRPLQQLRGFTRLHLEPGETRKVTFQVPAHELAFWDVATHAWKVEDGAFDVAVGSSSVDVRLRGHTSVAAAGAADGGR